MLIWLHVFYITNIPHNFVQNLNFLSIVDFFNFLFLSYYSLKRGERYDLFLSLSEYSRYFSVIGSFWSGKTDRNEKIRENSKLFENIEVRSSFL